MAVFPELATRARGIKSRSGNRRLRVVEPECRARCSPLGDARGKCDFRLLLSLNCPGTVRRGLRLDGKRAVELSVQSRLPVRAGAIRGAGHGRLRCLFRCTHVPGFYSLGRCRRNAFIHIEISCRNSTCQTRTECHLGQRRKLVGRPGRPCMHAARVRACAGCALRQYISQNREKLQRLRFLVGGCSRLLVLC